MVAAATSVRNFQPSAKVLSRSQGHSAAGKAAYNARCRIENERTGKVYSFGHLPNRAISDHFFPAANAPEWARTREGFWNGVEVKENRTDSQLAMDWIIPLPHELEAKPKDALLPLTDFIRENFQRRGYTADLVFHPAHDHGDERNFHAHLMVGLRRFEQDGSWAAKKDGVPDEKELRKLRERMTGKLNKYLQEHGYDVQLDCRSYQERGIDQEPTIHLGKNAAALERRGVRTEVGDMNRATEARNAEREAERQREREEAPQAERPRAQVEDLTPMMVASAIERQRVEDQAAQERAEQSMSRRLGMAAHARELLSAVRRLFTTLGASLGGVIKLDQGDARGQGITMRTDAYEQRRRLEELEAASYRKHIEEANAKAARLAKEAAAKAEPPKAEEKPRRGGDEPEAKPAAPRIIFTPATRKLQRTLKRPRPGHPDEDEPS